MKCYIPVSCSHVLLTLKETSVKQSVRRKGVSISLCELFFPLGVVGFWEHVWCSTSSRSDAELGMALVPGDCCHTPRLGAPALPGMELEFGGRKLCCIFWEQVNNGIFLVGAFSELALT